MKTTNQLRRKVTQSTGYDERDRAILRRFLDLIGSDLPRMARAIVNTPSRIDEIISITDARKLIHKSLRGQWPKATTTRRLAGWLLAQYLEAVNRGAVTSVSNFVYYILPDLEAPELFITPATARRRLLRIFMPAG